MAGITKFQSESDTVIYNADYPATVKIAEQSKGRKLKVVSLKLEEGDGCFVKNDQIVVRLNSLEEIIMSVNDIGLVGRHNWENVCAAIMAAKVLGIDNEHIVAATRAFIELNGFYNSKNEIRCPW